MTFVQLWFKSWVIKFLQKNICVSKYIGKVHTALNIYNFGSHAFIFSLLPKWFSSIVVVHITAMFNVHIRIGHRWNKGQRVLLHWISERMSCEEAAIFFANLAYLYSPYYHCFYESSQNFQKFGRKSLSFGCLDDMDK